MIYYNESNNFNNFDYDLKLATRKLLLQKYKLDESQYDYSNPASVEEFSEFHLDLYFLGLSQ